MNKSIGDPIFSERFRDGESAAKPLIEVFGGFIKRDATSGAELIKPSGAKSE